MNEEFNLMEEMCWAIDADNIKTINKQVDNLILTEGGTLHVAITLLTYIPNIINNLFKGKTISGSLRKSTFKKRINQLNKNLDHLYYHETKTSKECEFLYKRCEKEYNRIEIHINNSSDRERPYWIKIARLYIFWQKKFKKKADILRSENK